MQVNWDLQLLYAKLNGACNFPKDTGSCIALTLPDNKSIPYPLQLYNMAYYRKIYDSARTKFFATYPPGDECMYLFSSQCTQGVGVATSLKRNQTSRGMTAGPKMLSLVS